MYGKSFMEQCPPFLVKITPLGVPWQTEGFVTCPRVKSLRPIVTEPPCGVIPRGRSPFGAIAHCVMLVRR